ncbi:hypothetical protein HF325_000188 [Metschnikowia pulcherrima]|uniref:Peripheral subunit-binding (PSBD) domain-containing protein n=1 Tax=Metschnikowia pulcherrima TaxID=27326 RepID=A0A8H7GYR7_9ASCO|nr:hypothetical protein HF325_000188 [Metschnikowia pulcherrima]
MRQYYSPCPLGKTIALDKGIFLKNIKGSGPKGRIIAKTVENYRTPEAAPAASKSSWIKKC